MRHILPFGLLLLVAAPVDAGKIHMKHGYVIEAEYWWQDGPMLYYVRQVGRLQEAVSRADVERIEGTPQVPADLEWDFKNSTWRRRAGAGVASRSPASQGRDRFEACQPLPWVGEPETRIDAWLECLGPSYSRRQNHTVTAGSARTQHVIQYLGSNLLYIYTTNGTITAVQN